MFLNNKGNLRAASMREVSRVCDLTKVYLFFIANIYSPTLEIGAKANSIRSTLLLI